MAFKDWFNTKKVYTEKEVLILIYNRLWWIIFWLILILIAIGNLADLL